MSKRFREESDEGKMSSKSSNPLEKLRSYRNRKKDIENSSEKNKQPKKKAKTNDTNGETDDIEVINSNAQLSYTQKKQKIRETSELNEKIEIILSYVNEIKIVNEKVQELEKKDEIVTEAVLKNSDRLLYLEIEARKKNILIKGLEIHQDASNFKETREQTEECVGWFLSLINCNVKPLNSIRFTPTKKAIEIAQKKKKRVAPIIKVECPSEKSKAAVYAKLAEHGKIPELRGIMLCNDYPPSLKDILADLEKKAYTIRKDSNNKKKTKIVLKGNTLTLLVDGKEIKENSNVEN